ncbi:MAG TPA: hypothetical protein VK846_13460 [Candidatus Limnocylindria bacterium]|nr:hypothetical protein [Candidatus Limnocylindria bacterium]
MFSLLAIVAAVAVLAIRYFGPMPKVERRPHAALGEALAAQTTKLLGSGGRVTLIAPDTSAFRYPGAEVQLKTFHQALRRAGHTVAATNLIKLDPLRVVRVPPGDFAEILRKQSDADVVVSFMGPPVLSPAQKARVGEKRPKVIALCSGDMPRQINLHALFADHLLQAAVISRPRPGVPPASDTLSAWFDNYFQWVTPQNQTELLATETAGR